MIDLEVIQLNLGDVRSVALTQRKDRPRPHELTASRGVPMMRSKGDATSRQEPNLDRQASQLRPRYPHDGAVTLCNATGNGPAQPTSILPAPDNAEEPFPHALHVG